MTTSRTATLTMMAAVGLRPKKPVRCTSPPVRGEAAPSSLLSPLTLTSTRVSGAFASGAFASDFVVSGDADGVLTLGAVAGAGDLVKSCWASAIGATPATRRRAQN